MRPAESKHYDLTIARNYFIDIRNPNVTRLSWPVGVTLKNDCKYQEIDNSLSIMGVRSSRLGQVFDLDDLIENGMSKTVKRS